jgi:hypothetical protein
VKWIDIEKRYPENTELVLIYMPECTPKFDISFYSGGGWAFTDANLVTHWAAITKPEDV